MTPSYQNACTSPELLRDFITWQVHGEAGICKAFCKIHHYFNKKFSKLDMEIISKEIIKPSSPTPNHLKTLNLSMLDQLTFQNYIPLLILYKSELTRSSIYVLKKSLSETLKMYYPFAGRLRKDSVTVDCGDQGVVFVEAKMSGCTLSDFLQNPNLERQKLLFAEGFLWKGSCIGEPFVAVQVTSFEGGGMAVGFTISHKVADGCTYGTFLSDWAAMARGEMRPEPIILAKLIPSPDLKLNVPEIVMNQSRNCVTKRFAFGSKKIAELKNSVAGFVENPTSVEVVTAHLYMCVNVASMAKTGSFRKSTWMQLVNMRPRMTKPLPYNCIGNFSWYFTISNNGSQTSLSNLVLEMKNGIKGLCNGGNNVELSNWLMGIKKSTGNAKELFDDVDVYRCSSMVRSPFHDIDFGWGSPVWVTLADATMKNTFVLFDMPDGDGIEAVVSIEEDTMRLFQSVYNKDTREHEDRKFMSHL
uniref:tabersonine-19-hydroxy-O-acetyltransferase-like n=1 Tax=Erigeron canadensis TaxID=72917 RepID=UPI001CB942CD|nr:tabersonine-19-hydroxy-O-acetyltransferase-like [Erigeron canadensis]